MNSMVRSEDTYHICNSKLRLSITPDGIQFQFGLRTVPVKIFVDGYINKKHGKSVAVCRVEKFTHLAKENQLLFQIYADDHHVAHGFVCFFGESINVILRTLVHDEKIGVMWSPLYDLYLGDEYEPVDKKHVHSARYEKETVPEDDPHIRSLTVPACHEVFCDTAECASIFMPHNVDIKVFNHKGTVCCNAISKERMNLHFVKYSSKRECLSWYYKKYGREVKNIVIDKNTGIYAFRDILYHNWNVVKGDPPIMKLFVAQNIQTVLTRRNAPSAIFGSLAMYLHDLVRFPGDIDFVVPDTVNLVRVVNALKQEDETRELIENVSYPDKNSKWHKNAVRLTMKGYTVDIGHLSNFDIEKDTVEKQGLVVASRDHLLLVKLMGIFETTFLTHGHSVFEKKNYEAICSLVKNMDLPIHSFVADKIQELDRDMASFLLALLEEAEWDDSYIDTTYPLEANVFSDQTHTYIPVINRGDPCSGRVIIKKDGGFSNVHWHPLRIEDTVKSDLNVYNDRIAEVFIPTVNVGGVITLS